MPIYKEREELSRRAAELIRVADTVDEVRKASLGGIFRLRVQRFLILDDPALEDDPAVPLHLDYAHELLDSCRAGVSVRNGEC